MKLALSLVALIAAALILPVFFVPDGANHGARTDLLPWNVEVLPDGSSKVMGMQLGVTTLSEARSLFGPDMDVAIVTAPSEAGALEAYVASAKAGYITGRLVLVLEATGETVAAMRERASKTEYMESTTRKSTPTADDMTSIMAMPIRSIAFIPSINLERSAIEERFGAPDSMIRANDHQVHLLYPGRGLDVIIDSKGKELLQYVEPRHFDVLTAPLKDIATTTSGATTQ